MVATFETLAMKLAAVADLATQDSGPLTPQAKQALVRSTKDFKDNVREAYEFATSLPGGELSVEEQDSVIDMLEKLKERKRRQLAQFSQSVAAMASSRAQVQMEVDSNASTPA